MKVLNRLVKSALVVAMALTVVPLTATAQNFPDKPIKILVPFLLGVAQISSQGLLAQSSQS